MKRGIKMTFGQRLKQLIDDRNITQSQLAKELNITPSTLNGYVNDHREPDFQTLALFVRYFKVSSDYLLGISSSAHPAEIPMDHNMQRLFYYYQQLAPELKGLLIDQAKLLLKYNASQNGKPE